VLDLAIFCEVEQLVLDRILDNPRQHATTTRDFLQQLAERLIAFREERGDELLVLDRDLTRAFLLLVLQVVFELFDLEL